MNWLKFEYILVTTIILTLIFVSPFSLNIGWVGVGILSGVVIAYIFGRKDK